MILLHVPHSWPQALAGHITKDDAVRKEWHNIGDAALEAFGDVLLGICDHTVVAAFDVTGWSRDSKGWVTFKVKPSTAWSHLIGTPNPGKPWGVKGMARPVQYLDTAVVAGGSVEAEDTGTGRRAVIDGFTLAVDNAGSAVLTVPAGRKVTVLAGAS